MIIPRFLEKNDTIGVTACSCGVLKKIDKYEMTIKHFLDSGYKILETSNVRTAGPVSSDALTRVSELEELYKNGDVAMIIIASGGDYLYDILPLLDYNLIKNNVKWIAGSSDPSSLLFIITTNFDIATIYSPCNLSGMAMKNLHESLVNYMQIISGHNVKQLKYDYYEKEEAVNSNDYNLDTKNEWIKINFNSCNTTGVLIGGCIECLKDVIGTKFDKTKEFIERYKDEKVIWYFDVFSMPYEVLHNTLLQFKNAGWFKYTDLILIGKVKYPSTDDIDYYVNDIKSALNDVNVVFNFDVGHVKPSFTMINGSRVQIIINEEESSLKYLF